MTPDTDPWLRWAERIDAMRVMPRVLVVVMYAFFMYTWIDLVHWFMAYDWSKIKDQEAIALAIAGFPATILGVLTGVLANLTKSYWQGGRKWVNGGAPRDSE